MALPRPAGVPVAHAKLLSRQGARQNAWHNGIDLTTTDSGGSATRGAEVYPIANGVVDQLYNGCAKWPGLTCGRESTYGNYVVVKHANQLFSVYAHLDTVAVTQGQSVGLLTKLGTVGSTTALQQDGQPRSGSMAPHLHLEIVKAWPLASTDLASRYDILRELAASGINLGSGESLVATGVVTDYSEARLMKSLGPRSVELVGGYAKRWPLYVLAGGVVLTVITLYVAVRRRS
jgi:murein DD-endopeptidase MepM/ murein hydrolase activator NlpD